MSEQRSYGGIGLGGALFVLFLGLRLTDHIDWKWYWVAAPLWMPLLLALGIAILVVAGGLITTEVRARRALRRAQG